MESAGAKVLEPVMKVEVSGPEEYQGVLVASINRRKGVIQVCFFDRFIFSAEILHLFVIQDTMSDKGFVTVVCEVALSNMFGYSTDLRSSTQVLAIALPSPSHSRASPAWLTVAQMVF
jgi:elongation factor G